MDCLLGSAYGSDFNANQYACNFSSIDSTNPSGLAIRSAGSNGRCGPCALGR